MYAFRAIYDRGRKPSDSILAPVVYVSVVWARGVRNSPLQGGLEASRLNQPMLSTRKELPSR
jgi:hypothetical protein